MPLPNVDAMHRVFLDAIDRRPDTEVIRREGWLQVRTPSSTLRQHNKVLRADLSGRGAEEAIAAVVADHRQRGASLMWIHDPMGQPEDAIHWLEEGGLGRMGDGVGMARATAGAGSDGAVRVVPANLDNVDVFADVTARAWPLPASIAGSVGDWVRRAVEHPELRASHWLAYLGDDPVGSSSLVLLSPNLGYLRGAAVLPAARRRGVYSAMLRTRLRYCHEQGRDTAVIWAKPGASAPVAARLGFEEVPGARVTFFELEPS